MSELDKIVGTTITGIKGLKRYSDEVIISTSKGHLKFFHEQDCCESVTLEDFEDDGITFGAKVLSVEEVCSCDNPPENCDESFTWTFYKIETTKGGLWMRWLGESNGCYSESVDMEFTPH